LNDEVELPEPDVSYEAARDDSDLRYAYSAEAVRAAVLAEREANARKCEELAFAFQQVETNYAAGKKAGALACVEAIRKAQP
jgi:hypothetical protein